MNSRHIWCAAVVVLASANAVLFGQRPAFRARTDLVSVNVSVKDGRRPIADLTASDFELLDNGVRQEIDAVSLEHLSIDVTLVLTGFPEPQAAEHRRGLISASEVRQKLSPNDRLRLVVVGDDVKGRLVGPNYVVPTDNSDARQIPGVALTDGLFYALAWPVDPDRRHLVVAFTNGQDTYSANEPDRLPALVDRSDAVLHAVLWDSPPATRPTGNVISYGSATSASGTAQLAAFPVHGWEESYRLLLKAVDRSGGSLHHAAAGTEVFQTILDDFRTSYVLRYTPRGVVTKGWHELTVKVARRGSFDVRARKGYEGF